MTTVSTFIGQVYEGDARRRRGAVWCGPVGCGEDFTGRPGAYVPVRDTVASFKEILEGKVDDLPEQAFFLAGTLDDVRANAAKWHVDPDRIGMIGFSAGAMLTMAFR